MKGDSRSEMRFIRALVAEKNYTKIAQQFRKMKRIWEGKELDGLLKRRDAEADLVESCA
jgi:GH24 family phage-related lysozyme (muramidase)